MPTEDHPGDTSALPEDEKKEAEKNLQEQEASKADSDGGDNDAGDNSADSNPEENSGPKGKDGDSKAADGSKKAESKSADSEKKGDSKPDVSDKKESDKQQVSTRSKDTMPKQQCVAASADCIPGSFAAEQQKHISQHLDRHQESLASTYRHCSAANSIKAWIALGVMLLPKSGQAAYVLLQSSRHGLAGVSAAQTICWQDNSWKLQLNKLLSQQFGQYINMLQQ